MINLDIEALAFEFQTTAISLTKLAKREKTTRQTLSKYFKNLGIDVINKQNRVKFDETIFDCIDCEEKAYWLGFIFADGYVSNKEYVLELSLSSIDVNHLTKFNTFMKYQGNNVKIGNSKCKNKVFQRCRWCIRNKHLWSTLIEYGCTPNKSLTLKFPNINIFAFKELIIPFIRGYFDGDGCLTRYVYSTNVSPRIQIIGTSDFLDGIDKYSCIKSRRSHDKRHTNSTYFNDYTKDDSIKFINLIYSNCNISLDRKFKLFDFFKNGSRSIQEWIELSSGNIGEKPEMENPEINLEGNMSESSYSVEGETNGSIR